MKDVLQINNFIKKNRSKNLLLLTGNKSFIDSGFKKTINDIESKVNFVRYSNFSQNPEINDLFEGIKFFNNKKCDALIAVGGGSVIDMGKLIALLSNCKLIDIDGIKEYAQNNKREVPLMCIPTTAGSGAEATHFSVLYCDGIKHSISNPTLIPDSHILNPKYSYKTNQYQRAISGLDALSQGIESMWAKESTEESIIYSKKAVQLIWNNLYQSVILNDFDAHKNVFEGSHLAGKAINISKTTAPHAISYPFTSLFGIDHGHAVSLTLEKFLSFNFENVNRSVSSFNLSERYKIIFKLFKAKNIEGLSDKIKSFENKIKNQRPWIFND